MRLAAPPLWWRGGSAWPGATAGSAAVIAGQFTERSGVRNPAQDLFDGIALVVQGRLRYRLT